LSLTDDCGSIWGYTVTKYYVENVSVLF